MPPGTVTAGWKCYDAELDLFATLTEEDLLHDAMS
jgi:hypothetical protein